MSRPLSETDAVGVVGAGAMGAGIAQVAALAGHTVRLYDTRAGAAETAIAGIRKQFLTLRDKNRISAAECDRAAAGLHAADGLDAFTPCALVVEAIVEDLPAKRQLFLEVEKRVSVDVILATNTSSISITRIGAALAHPERLVGMHFFNPAPVMPLVEVISGALTHADVADRVFATAARWRKTPVHAKSTPGFIVNRVARPYYAEGLRLLQEGVASASTIDAVLREAGGFRMGPFELMDLIGHDVNYAVTRSVFDAYYGDPRFAPSQLQLELVDAGLLGRKSDRGFYDYREQATPQRPSAAEPEAMPADTRIHTASPLGAALAARLAKRGVRTSEIAQVPPDGRIAEAQGAVLYLTDGRSATRRAAESGHAGTVLVDLMLDAQTSTRTAIAAAEQCDETARRAMIGLLQAAGYTVSLFADSPGLAVMRTVAMLANEGADAVHQGVCSAHAVDVAMRGGVNYPLGPLEWADRIGAQGVLQVLDHLAQHYGESRYRASALLRQRAWSKRSLRDD